MDRYLSIPKRSYNSPFYVMLIIAILLSISAALVYIQTADARTGKFKNASYNYWYLLWPLLIWIETILYRVIRRKIVTKHYVWLHISVVAFIHVIMPVVSTLILLNLRSGLDNNSYYNKYDIIRKIQGITFWFFFIIGHAFFITTIAKSFKRKEAEDNEQATSILDGIIDEY